MSERIDEKEKEIVVDVSDIDLTGLEDDPKDVDLGQDDDISGYDLDGDDPPPDDKNKPAWLKDEPEGDVPLGAHIGMRSKLKGKISDQDDEIIKLKAENDQLRSSGPAKIVPGSDIGPRPKSDDYDDDAKHQAALAVWEDKRADERYSRIEAGRDQKTAHARQQEHVNKEVDSHYERAADLVSKHGIDADVYKTADKAFRSVIESVLPNMGDSVADNFIARLGKGSEKTIFQIGRSKARLAEFQSAFVNDKTGFEAAIYLGNVLGQIKKTSITKPKSNAPSPAPDLGGGEASKTVNSTSLKKMFLKAKKNGDGQAEYNIYKKAKAAGVDVSTWR